MSRSRSSPGEPAIGPAPGASRDPLERIAFLLSPVGVPATYLAADGRWRLPPPDMSRSAVWGRPALPSGTARASVLRSAAARERAIANAKRRPGARVHRMPPQRLGGGSARNALRAALLGGVAIELPAAGSGRRVIDEAAEAAGVREPLRAMHLSSSGALVASVRHDGTDAVLRVGVAGAPGDPARGAEALAHLSPLDAPIPRLMATGETAGASWALESRLPGARPDELDDGLARRVADVCSDLPAGNGPPAAPRRDLEALAALLPDREEAFQAVARGLRAELRALPSIMRHGDLWTGNLLVDGSTLSGIVDWDAWDPGAVPGADQLHLYATARRIAERCELGEIWMRRPWRDAAYRSLLAGHATAVPDDVLAIAWWACEVRGTVSRHPARAVDQRWLATNVDAVLRELRP